MAIPWLTARPLAHRGFHDAKAGRIENSASSARAAAERGFAIEVDLRITADGGVVVFHDATLTRLCAVDRKVADARLDWLTGQRLVGGNDTILAFSDLLRIVGGRVPLFLELKTDRATDDRLLRAVAGMLSAYQGPAAVMSFDHAAIARFQALAPKIPCGLIADAAAPGTDTGALPPFERFVFRHVLRTLTIRPEFIAYNVRALPDPAITLMRALSLVKVLAWTVRTPADLAKQPHYDQMIFEGFDPGASR